VALTGQTKVIRSTAPTVTGHEAELIPSAQFSRPEIGSLQKRVQENVLAHP